MYPALINPNSVLEALYKAYDAKDSVEIKLIYDQDYRGISFDPANQNQLPTIYKSDEVRHIQALHAAGPAPISVDLVFPSNTTRETDLSDPPGWTTIKIQGMILTIDDPNKGDVFHLVANETWEFKFSPTLNTASSTDTTWQIVRWTELP